MGAKFSFGTNNFDPGPKDLSKWLEAIVWLDLGHSDIWTPQPVFLSRKPQPKGATHETNCTNDPRHIPLPRGGVREHFES